MTISFGLIGFKDPFESENNYTLVVLCAEEYENGPNYCRLLTPSEIANVQATGLCEDICFHIHWARSKEEEVFAINKIINEEKLSCVLLDKEVLPFNSRIGLSLLSEEVTAEQINEMIKEIL